MFSSDYSDIDHFTDSSVLSFLKKSLEAIDPCIKYCKRFNRDVRCNKIKYDKSIASSLEYYYKEINLEYCEKNVFLGLIKHIDEGNIVVDDEFKQDLSFILDRYRKSLMELRSYVVALYNDHSIICENEDSYIEKVSIPVSNFIDYLDFIINIRYQFDLTTNIENISSDDFIQLPFQQKFTDNDIVSY